LRQDLSVASYRLRKGPSFRGAAEAMRSRHHLFYSLSLLSETSTFFAKRGFICSPYFTPGGIEGVFLRESPYYYVLLVSWPERRSHVESYLHKLDLNPKPGHEEYDDSVGSVSQSESVVGEKSRSQLRSVLNTVAMDYDLPAIR